MGYSATFAPHALEFAMSVTAPVAALVAGRAGATVRCVHAALLALMLAATLLVAHPVQSADAAPASKKERAYGAAAEKATNAQRVAAGRRKVRADGCLAKWAARHAQKLARKGGGIRHQDIRKVLRDCRLTMVGENVAMGFPSGGSVVKQGWMKSPGHKRNLLERRYTRGEVVARRSSSGTWYAVQLFGRG